MIRVLLADDHVVVRDGLRRMLAATGDIAVVAEAGHGDEVLQRLSAVPADVLVMDVSMPGPGFLEVLRTLRERHPRVRVVILSAHAEEEYAERALKSGALAYVTKERSPEELQEAIRRAARGVRYVSERLAAALADRLAGQGVLSGHDLLSEREFEVLRLLGRGRSVKEIGALLAVSPKTVSTYRARILEKLRLAGTAELIRYAIEHRLTD